MTKLDNMNRYRKLMSEIVLASSIGDDALYNYLNDVHTKKNGDSYDGWSILGENIKIPKTHL